MQVFYTVRSGDTIYQIARRWALPVESLIAANNLASPNMIDIGQQLSIPPGVDVVRVRMGDSVYKIAQFYGVPSSVIIEANDLQPPYVLQAGQLLRVPQGLPYYVVQPGDTLFEIARRFNVVTQGIARPELIQQVNQLPSTNIFPGNKLVIPYAPPGELGLIAYNTNRRGSYDIWLYDLRSGVNKQLTSGLGEDYSIPFWSPDSSKIAFVGRDGILFVVETASGEIARIDQFSDGQGIYLNWSHDSEKLAYTNQNAIILYNINTHQANRINQPGATDVQWFPNGTELLYQAPDLSGGSQLFRIQEDGTGRQQITQNTGTAFNNVRLSPNGTYVLYTTPGVSISIIYTLELASGNVFEVQGGPLAKNYFPVWSPDSTEIAYSATAFEEVGYFSLIKVTGRRGDNDRTKAISDCFATPVTWSPNGKKTAYLSGCDNQGTASEIWMIDVAHPAPTQLVKNYSITSLQWSPTPVSLLEATYTNTLYNVQFNYPSHWQKVTDQRYEGADGFFQISAISSEGTFQEVCHNEAFQQLLPYGSNPRIIPSMIQSQAGCFIFPSADQLPDMRGQAALIIPYPEPVNIGGQNYNYFILWADQKHIKGISETFIFIV